MSKLTAFLKLAICVFLFTLKVSGRTPTYFNISVLLTYNDSNSHAVYDASALRGAGTLSFVFKTGKSDTFLAYQDDRSYSNFDFFLVNGTISTTINFENCCKRKLIIEGNYSDGQWHRVSLARQLHSLTLTVDGCHSQTISCCITNEKWFALYVGSIPIEIERNLLANPNIHDQAITSG